VDDLRAIPRIDIYGEEEARAVLRGEHDPYTWAPAAVSTTAPGGGSSNGSYPYTVVSGTRYAAGGSGGCGSSNCVSGGSSSGWSNSMWSVHAYGNPVHHDLRILT